MKPTRASLHIKRLQGPIPLEDRQYRAVADLPVSSLSYSVIEYNGHEWHIVAGPMKQALAERIAACLNLHNGESTHNLRVAAVQKGRGK